MSRKHLTHSAGACVFCVTHPPQERMSRRDRSQNGFIAVSLRDTLAELRQAEENPQRPQSEWLHRGVTPGKLWRAAEIRVTWGKLRRAAEIRVTWRKLRRAAEIRITFGKVTAGSGNSAGGWRKLVRGAPDSETGPVRRNWAGFAESVPNFANFAVLWRLGRFTRYSRSAVE